MKPKTGAACIVLLAANISWAEGMQEQAAFPFSFEPVPGKTVTVDLAAGSEVFATLPGSKPQTLGVVETFNVEDRVQHIAEVADFNFDEALDVAILDGIGYGGVNLFYRLFLWDRTDNRFQEYPEPIGNPVLETNTKQLVSSQRSGPKWYTTTYRSAQGVLYPAVAQVMAGSSGDWDYLIFKEPAGKVTGHKVIASGEHKGEIAEELPDAVAVIQVAKAYLHDQPNAASKTRMYVIQQDKVTLLDWKATEGDAYGGEGWFLIRYQGRKVIEKWIEGSALVKE